MNEAVRTVDDAKLCDPLSDEKLPPHSMQSRMWSMKWKKLSNVSTTLHRHFLQHSAAFKFFFKVEIKVAWAEKGNKRKILRVEKFTLHGDARRH